MAEKTRLHVVVPQGKQPGQGCIPPLSPLLHGSGHNTPNSSPEDLTVPGTMDDVNRQPSMESLASSSSDEVVIPEDTQETSGSGVVNLSIQAESGQQPAEGKSEAQLTPPRFRRRERKISVRHPRKASGTAVKVMKSCVRLLSLREGLLIRV